MKIVIIVVSNDINYIHVFILATDEFSTFFNHLFIEISVTYKAKKQKEFIAHQKYIIMRLIAWLTVLGLVIFPMVSSRKSSSFDKEFRNDLNELKKDLKDGNESIKSKMVPYFLL